MWNMCVIMEELWKMAMGEGRISRYKYHLGIKSWGSASNIVYRDQKNSKMIV